MNSSFVMIRCWCKLWMTKECNSMFVIEFSSSFRLLTFSQNKQFQCNSFALCTVHRVYVCMRIVRENKLDICTYCLENVEIRVHADWLAMDRVGSLDVVVRAEMARCVQILRLLAVVQALRPFEFAIDLVHALLQLHLIPNMKVVDSLSRPDSLAELLALVGSVHSDANHSVRFSIF